MDQDTTAYDARATAAPASRRMPLPLTRLQMPLLLFQFINSFTWIVPAVPNESGA